MTADKTLVDVYQGWPIYKVVTEGGDLYYECVGLDCRAEDTGTLKLTMDPIIQGAGENADSDALGS